MFDTAYQLSNGEVIPSHNYSMRDARRKQYSTDLIVSERTRKGREPWPPGAVERWCKQEGHYVTRSGLTLLSVLHPGDI